MRQTPHFITAVFLLAATTALADGPRDNNPDSVRPVPRPGVKPAGSGYLPERETRAEPESTFDSEPESTTDPETTPELEY